MGKGDKNRTKKWKSYRNNHDRIFKEKQENKEKVEKATGMKFDDSKFGDFGKDNKEKNKKGGKV